MSIRINGIEGVSVSSVGLGVFDGLHLGHMELVNQCDTLLTFHPHPDTVLNKESDLKHLTTLDEMRVLFKQVLALEFSMDIARLSPQAFLDTILMQQLNPKRVVVGYDYRFGSKRAGDFSFLSQWAESNGIEAVEVTCFSMDGEPVKSGRIRRALLSGDFDSALRWLGHSYLIEGTVVRGDGRGASLGFPTANLAVSDIKLIPAKGVYGGRVMGRTCIVYIGDKPTFGGQAQSIEVHIPGFDGDLYDQTLMVELTQRIRGEMQFPDADALVAQIREDMEVLDA